MEKYDCRRWRNDECKCHTRRTLGGLLPPSLHGCFDEWPRPSSTLITLLAGQGDNCVTSAKRYQLPFYPVSSTLPYKLIQDGGHDLLREPCQASRLQGFIRSSPLLLLPQIIIRVLEPLTCSFTAGCAISCDSAVEISNTRSSSNLLTANVEQSLLDVVQE